MLVRRISHYIILMLPICPWVKISFIGTWAITMGHPTEKHWFSFPHHDQLPHLWEKLHDPFLSPYWSIDDLILCGFVPTTTTSVSSWVHPPCYIQKTLLHSFPDLWLLHFFCLFSGAPWAMWIEVYGGLNVIGPYKLRGSGTLRNGSFLEEVCYWIGVQALRFPVLKLHRATQTTSGCLRSRCRTLNSFSSAMFACTPLCPTMMIME